MSTSCLFCNIRDSIIPSEKIYEDDTVFAILDIHPVNPGHALIISKEHYDTTAQTPDAVLGAMAAAAKRVASGILRALDYEAYNIEVNNGAIAGQLVMHTHWHVIPRRSDDRLAHWPGTAYEEGEAGEVGRKIRENL